MARQSVSLDHRVQVEEWGNEIPACDPGEEALEAAVRERSGG